MNEYSVVFAPEAEAQLAELYGYIAEKSSANAALSYTTGIVDYCTTLKTFPHRGIKRDDLRPGLRITNYKGNAVIAFAVDDTTMTVSIVGVFYGGQDYAVDLGAGDD
ncbi:MAG: type II toxin-antitoxin system RelE/ParE family toxin [Telluria sp.]|nr:type II toxin-antitoxin system RelE/ParE family toxin [Telluria sp.]